jgi:transcription elongation factor Elf1
MDPKTIECPFCGEPNDVFVETSEGSQNFIQDCEVCCQPIGIRARVHGEDDVEIDVVRSGE